MQDDLYFIPIIAQALEGPDQRAALRQALQRIREMGRQDRYRAGFRMFLEFLRLACGPQGQRQVTEAASRTAERAAGDAWITVSIEKDGAPLAVCTFEPGCGPKTVQSVTPGHYRIKLQTGRVLWQGHLTDQDVRFGDIPMAAGVGEPPPPREERAVHGDGILVLRVRPGLEAGTLELGLAKPGRER